MKTHHVSPTGEESHPSKPDWLGVPDIVIRPMHAGLGGNIGKVSDIQMFKDRENQHVYIANKNVIEIYK